MTAHTATVAFIAGGLIWSSLLTLAWSLCRAGRGDEWRAHVDDALALTEPEESIYDAVARVLASNVDREWAELDGAL